MSSSPADRVIHGSVAAGWIDGEAPEAIHSLLTERLERWRADPASPIAALWHNLALAARHAGCYDAEIGCWLALDSLFPGEPAVQLRLAEALHRVGDEDGARAALAVIPPAHPSRAAALLLALELEGGGGDDAAAIVDELTRLLVARPVWDQSHHLLVRRLVALGLHGQAVAVLAHWPHGSGDETRDHLLERGWLAMHAGDAIGARHFFERLWTRGDPTINGVAGRFDGAVPPYDAVVEQDIRQRIDAAFALPEEALARVATGRDDALPPVRVLFAGYERMALPNDLAEHFQRSALDAGIDFHAHLDNAIVFADHYRGTDEEVRLRVAAFEAVLEARRPDVVMLDCGYMPSQRGLRPERMVELAHSLGFRLVCVMRDALEGGLPYLRAWLAAADTMVILDPCSPLLATEEAADKVLLGWGPSMHLPPGRAEGGDLGLVFIGADSYGVRNMLLSVLLTEDIAFTAITGHRRAEVTPDMDSYVGVLKRARAVLNVAAHSHSEFLVTARVFEVVAAAGGVLVEQDNPGTARYFTPWRHYLPWRNVDDIVQLWRFVERNPGVAERMVAEARTWGERYYHHRRLWSAILHHACRS